MNHKGTITIETPRLILRRFTPDDAESMFRNLFSGSEAMRYLPWTVHLSISETEKLLGRFIGGYVKSDCYTWAIVPEDFGEPIGFIAASAYRAINAVKIDFGIGRQWWHKGLTSEALSAIIEFFFEEVGANRIYSTHDPRNPNSGRVMEKCGMKYEGILRQTRYRKGEYSDRATYSILADEYFSRQSNTTVDVHPIDTETRPMVTEFLTNYWSGTFILIRGEAVDITTIDGFAVVKNGSLTGIISYIVRGEACEIVSLNSTAERRGVGTALVNAVIARAREFGCRRVQLLTTNDNLNAIGFYQRRGFDLVGINLGEIDRAREQKPSIPLIGQNGIPIRHEIEFAMNLYSISKPGRDEIYEIAKLFHDSWQTAYSDIIAPEFLAAMSVSERHEKLLLRFDGDISKFLVLRYDDKIIGTAVFGKSFTEGYPNDGEVSAIYLHNRYIGKGYGHALFAEIERILADMGYAHFVLDVLSENKIAVNFYLNHGYEKVSESSIRLDEKDYPLSVFRR